MKLPNRYALELIGKPPIGEPVETTLSTGERRYRALAEAIPQLVGIVDSALQLVYANERVRTYTGQTIAAINDTAAAWIVHREDQYRAADAQAAIAAQVSLECELRLRRADGAYRWHRVCMRPIEETAGEPARWLVIATDVEDQKSQSAIIREMGDPRRRPEPSERAETTVLREANRLLVMAEEMAHVGHYRLDLTSNEVYWSDEIYTTYGLPSSFKPTLGSALAAYHPDDRDRVVELIGKTLVDGRTFTFNARVVRPDGTVRAVVVGGQVERTADGKIVALFGVLQDVTSFKDREREREKLSERVMLATKAGKIGIWEWNIATGALEWDGAMYTLYGIDDLTPVKAFDLWIARIHPADRKKAEAEIRCALDGAGFDIEFSVIWPTGNVRHLHTMGTLLHDPAGAGSRMVGATWDITEVRVLADDLRAEKERAEAATRAKSDFLARMSHEIRTPMNGIIGFATLVLDGELSAEQRHHVTLLGDAGRSLLAIINDILDFSKLEAGKIELEVVPLNLSALVDGALSIVRGDARPKGIMLDGRIAADLPAWVNGDPTRLRQTLLNLLTNALKFTDRGSIRVSVMRDAEAPHERLRFEIADTGIGIAADKRHLLFRDFSQLEKSTTRRYGGTGLGLAICKHLAEAMGGTIGVESEPGAGSVFWFTARLPPVAAPTLACSDSPELPVASRRILVADDNRVNQIVVEALLTRDGHTVVLVENGAQATAAVRSGRFDLVLMDMQMPVMDGIEATRAIRTLPAPAGTVPIVALTANAMDAEVEACYSAGMNGHLAKPIDRDLLRRSVARWTHAESPPAPSAPLTDTRTLGIATLLELFDGDVAQVGDIFTAALASITADRSRIAASALAGDVQAVIEGAHRIKGTSGSIRSLHVLESSTRIEQAAKLRPLVIDPALLQALDAAVTEFRADVGAFLRSLATAS